MRHTTNIKAEGRMQVGSADGILANSVLGAARNTDTINSRSGLLTIYVNLYVLELSSLSLFPFPLLYLSNFDIAFCLL